MIEPPAIGISIIIPVRDRAGAIARCIAGVHAGGFDPSRHELIVVDNGSSDGSAETARAAGARVLGEPVPNRCLARNLGARHAAGRWLLFIDSDCVPEPGWLPALERAFAETEAGHPRRALIAGAVLDAPPANEVEAYIARRRWLSQEKFLAPGRRFSPPFAATAHLAVRRDVCLELGGLDPELAVAGEDADFCWRAAAAGWELHYAPDAAVVHHHRATLGELARQSYHYGIGNAELFARWRGRWGARAWIEPRHYLWGAKAAVKSPFAALLGRSPAARREPFYDAVANFAMACGRVRGGLRRRVPVA